MAESLNFGTKVGKSARGSLQGRHRTLFAALFPIYPQAYGIWMRDRAVTAGPATVRGAFCRIGPWTIKTT